MAYLEAVVNFEMSLISFLSYKNVKDRMGSSNAEAYISLRRKLEDVIVEEGDDRETGPRKKVQLIDDNQLMEHPSKMLSDMINTKLNEIGARIGMQKITRKVGGIEQLSYIREFAKTLEQKLIIFFSIFDLNSLTSGKMTPSVWVKCLNDMLFVLDIVEHYSNIVATDESVELKEIESHKAHTFGTVCGNRQNQPQFSITTAVNHLREMPNHSQNSPILETEGIGGAGANQIAKLRATLNSEKEKRIALEQQLAKVREALKVLQGQFMATQKNKEMKPAKSRISTRDRLGPHR
ncbi:hypothetical protein GIB67_043037, partial [Kingdonia uniflora]